MGVNSTFAASKGGLHQDVYALLENVEALVEGVNRYRMVISGSTHVMPQKIIAIPPR